MAVGELWWSFWHGKNGLDACVSDYGIRGLAFGETQFLTPHWTKMGGRREIKFTKWELFPRPLQPCNWRRWWWWCIANDDDLTVCLSVCLSVSLCLLAT